VGALEIVRVIAIVSSGLFAGILFGDRMGASFARPALSASSFLQFQRIQHTYFARLMPPLALSSIAGALVWLILARAQWNTAAFWLVAVAAGDMITGFALTLTVNVPINNQMMTWNVAAPPDNVREIWARWESVHTVRTILWVTAFAMEAVAAVISAK